MFFVWGVVARLLEKKSRPFLIKQRVESLWSLCVFFVKNLIVVCKKKKRILFVVSKQKKPKKMRQKKKQKRDYSFCKITLKTIDYREDDDEDHLDEDDEEDYYYS